MCDHPCSTLPNRHYSSHVAACDGRLLLHLLGIEVELDKHLPAHQALDVQHEPSLDHLRAGRKVLEPPDRLLHDHLHHGHLLHGLLHGNLHHLTSHSEEQRLNEMHWKVVFVFDLIRNWMTNKY